MPECLGILYTRHTTNDTVRSIMGCLPVFEKVKLFRAPGSISSRGGPSPCHRRRVATTTWLAETSWSPKIHLAEGDRWGRSAPELWGPHGLEEAKDRDTWHQVVSTATLC